MDIDKERNAQETNSGWHRLPRLLIIFYDAASIDISRSVISYGIIFHQRWNV